MVYGEYWAVNYHAYKSDGACCWGVNQAAVGHHAEVHAPVTAEPRLRWQIKRSQH